MSEQPENPTDTTDTTGAGPTPEDTAPQSAPAATVEGRRLFPRAPLGRIPLVLGGLLLVALVAAGVVLARRELRKEEAPTAVAAPETLQLETPQPASAAPASPLHAEPSLPPDKIFNNTLGALKADAAKIGANSSVEGSISKLPPPPHAGPGLHDMQDAAKDAANLLRPKKEGAADIDLSAPQPEAAIESLERVAAAGSDDAPPPSLDSTRLLDEVAGLKQALTSEVAGLSATLTQERQRTESQAAEILRLTSELERLRAADSPALRRAREALAVSELTSTVREGAPYRRQLDTLRALAPPSAATDALDAFADEGLPSASLLRAEFPALRNEALAEARREDARGPLGRLGANFASLIRLRPATPRKGSSAAAVLSRAEARLAADDLAAAVREIDGLAGGAAAVFKPWTERARARLAAEADLASLNGAVVAALQAERDVR